MIVIEGWSVGYKLLWLGGEEILLNRHLLGSHSFFGLADSLELLGRCIVSRACGIPVLRLVHAHVDAWRGQGYQYWWSVLCRAFSGVR